MRLVQTSLILRVSKHRGTIVGTNEKSKGEKSKRQPLDIRSLKESREFTIIFDNDKGMKCQLIEADSYNLLVSQNGKKVLIPKHSVKYVIL